MCEVIPVTLAVLAAYIPRPAASHDLNNARRLVTRGVSGDLGKGVLSDVFSCRHSDSRHQCCNIIVCFFINIYIYIPSVTLSLFGTSYISYFTGDWHQSIDLVILLDGDYEINILISVWDFCPDFAWVYNLQTVRGSDVSCQPWRHTPTDVVKLILDIF